MPEERPKTITLTIFNTQVEVPVFQSIEKTIEMSKKIENHMFKLYEEYGVFLTQMIAIRTAYDFLVLTEILKEKLDSMTNITLEVLKEITNRINMIREEVENTRFDNKP